jgi:hypothetical protein
MKKRILFGLSMGFMVVSAIAQDAQVPAENDLTQAAQAQTLHTHLPTSYYSDYLKRRAALQSMTKGAPPQAGGAGDEQMMKGAYLEQTESSRHTMRRYRPDTIQPASTAVIDPAPWLK